MPLIVARSTDGGEHFAGPTFVQPATQPGVFDPVLGRPVIDGVAGARSDLAPAPSVDIANGAPTGADATNRIVVSYVSGNIDQPHVKFTESTGGGAGDLPVTFQCARPKQPRRHSRCWGCFLVEQFGLLERLVLIPFELV